MDQDEVTDVVRRIMDSAAKETCGAESSQSSRHKTRVVIEGFSMTMTVTRVVVTRNEDDSSR